MDRKLIELGARELDEIRARKSMPFMVENYEDASGFCSPWWYSRPASFLLVTDSTEGF